MADWYGKGEDGDFQEEDVWGGVMNEREDSTPQVIENSRKAHRRRKSSGSTCSSAWSLNGASKMKNVPRSQEAKVVVPHQHQQSSVPVNVPDWSKIYGGGKSRVGHEDIGSYQECVHVHVHDDDDDGGDDEIVPPHEYIARRMARTQISSFSMCEGVGRTLKGRDLSKLRNAILTKTGFLE